MKAWAVDQTARKVLPRGDNAFASSNLLKTPPPLQTTGAYNQTARQQEAQRRDRTDQLETRSLPTSSQPAGAIKSESILRRWTRQQESKAGMGCMSAGGITGRAAARQSLPSNVVPQFFNVALGAGVHPFELNELGSHC